VCEIRHLACDERRWQRQEELQQRMAKVEAARELLQRQRLAKALHKQTRVGLAISEN